MAEKQIEVTGPAYAYAETATGNIFSDPNAKSALLSQQGLLVMLAVAFDAGRSAETPKAPVESEPKESDDPRAHQLADYRKAMAKALAALKARVDQGDVPECGLRLMTPDSATIVPDTKWGFLHPWAELSLDSRDREIYAIAHNAAADLVAYVHSLRSLS